MTRYIYWSSWGTNAKIERATVGGNFQEPVVNSSLVWPSGLTVDHEEDLLYWADASLYVSLVSHVGAEKEFFPFTKKRDLHTGMKI